MASDATISGINNRNEFAKFTKFLAYKSVQVIVESRKGIKIEPNSKQTSSDSDWFNLQIPDSPEVNYATKHALPSDKILDKIKSRVHVEISVKTDDGDDMVLELWTLELDENQFDTSLKVMHEIYFRMSILLKSLISVTRITPAYYLSRKQHNEPFTVFYRVYSEEPKLEILGDSSKSIQAGLLKTPLGGIIFTVAYRTNFSLPENPKATNKAMILKSDHFELSPDSKKRKEAKRQIDLNKPLRLTAFVDESLLQKAIAEFLTKIPLPVLKLRPEQEPEKVEVQTQSTEEVDKAVSENRTSKETTPEKFDGFRSENEPPLKLLHFPFADDHPICELAEFYKNFFNAPHLKLSDGDVKKNTNSDDTEASDDDLGTELDRYASSVEEFDKLLEDMYKSAEGLGNSRG